MPNQIYAVSLQASHLHSGVIGTVLPSENVNEMPSMGKHSGFGRPPPSEIMPGIRIKGIKAWMGDGLRARLRRVSNVSSGIEARPSGALANTADVALRSMPPRPRSILDSSIIVPNEERSVHVSANEDD